MAKETQRFKAKLKRALHSILSRIIPIPRFDSYCFKIHSNIVISSTTRPSKRSLSCRFTFSNFESIPTFYHSGYMPCPSQSSRLNHSDYMNGTNYEVPHVVPCPLPMFILPGAEKFASGSCFQIPMM